MNELYRAVYTRCFVGIDFNSIISSQDGQKIFSTSENIIENLSLSRESISLIDSEIKRDIYSAGMRSYLNDACRYFYCNGISVLLYYRWLNKSETGGRELGITKALIGNFDKHPIEYFCNEFFSEKNYFFDYPDADGKQICEFKQLHTFNAGKTPPYFPVIKQENIFGFPAISFEQAGDFVLQSTYVKERVSAAVCHLVRQFSLPENQRKGIAVKGTIEQIRYWLASIEYAFSAIAALKVSYSIAFPPTGFPYNFSASALVGWDIQDVDLEKLNNRMPSNLVLLDNLPLADAHEYYDAITKFDGEHRSFIDKGVMKNDDIENYPKLYEDYYKYIEYKIKLQSHSFEADTNFFEELHGVIENYTTTQLYIHKLYSTVLRVIEKNNPKSDNDIFFLIKIYENIEKMISDEVVKEESKSYELLYDELKQHYINRFCNIFISILSNEYLFCNADESKEPRDFFVVIVEKKEEWAFEIARFLIQDEQICRYTFSFAPNSKSKTNRQSWENVIYSRLSFLNDMMVWHKHNATDSTIWLVCKAFDEIFHFDENTNNFRIKEFKRKIIQHNSKNIFNLLFIEAALDKTSKAVPENKNDINELINIYDIIENIISKESQSSIEILQKKLNDNFVNHFVKIFISILSSKYSYCNEELTKKPEEYFINIKQKRNNSAFVIAQWLLEDKNIEQFDFLYKPNNNSFNLQFLESIVYPRISFVSYLLKNYQKPMTNSMVLYVCKAFNEVLLQKKLPSLESIYNSIFSPFNNNENYGIITYRDSGYIPVDFENKPYFEMLEKVFLYDFVKTLNEIGRKKFDIDMRVKEARKYIQACLKSGFSENIIIFLYKELLNVDDVQSMFYYLYSFDIFYDNKENVYPMLFDYCIDMILAKIFQYNKYKEDVDDYYLSILHNFLKKIKRNEELNVIDVSIWKHSCEKIDAHLEKIFEYPKHDWIDRCTNKKSSSLYDIIQYFRDNELFLPNTDRINIFEWLNTYNDGSADEIKNISYVLSIYIKNSNGFTNCNKKYKQEIINLIKSKGRWTGKIYKLIFHLFEFDDDITYEIMYSLDGLKTLNNKDYLFCELCDEMYEKYQSNKNKEMFKKFLDNVKKVYPKLYNKRQNDWGGHFYLLLIMLFEYDNKFVKYILKTMVENNKDRNLSDFCFYCYNLGKAYKEYPKETSIINAWNQTKEFCYDLKKNKYDSVYREILKELKKNAGKYSGVPHIIEWLEPEDDGPKKGYRFP